MSDGVVIGHLPAGSTIIRQAGTGDFLGNPRRLLLVESDGDVFWLHLDGTRERVFKKPARTGWGLMLRARWRAWKHIRFFFPRRGCAIWRLYSCLGLKTHRVFCQCGEEFE